MRQPSDIIHLGLRSSIRWIKQYHTACGVTLYARWVTFNKRSVTCKICLRVKESTIRRRIDFIKVEEVMES